MRSSLRRLAALAMIAVIGVGCSNTGDSSDNDAATNREQAAKFSACMRENGVSEFPDPDASGGLTIDGVLNGSSLDPSTPAWKTAIGACEDLQPPGFIGHKRTAPEQENALKFAQCIRDNGVKDFPDPAADAPLVDTNRIPSAASDDGLQVLNAAMAQCGEWAELALNDK